mmetsp:Transcript_126023/g.351155  ORF Transcript_126023/g.351155 Transcript_126023/m.351155 type:complete len:348 (+) Transcript_126023:244-1287(+)
MLHKPFEVVGTGEHAPDVCRTKRVSARRDVRQPDLAHLLHPHVNGHLVNLFSVVPCHLALCAAKLASIQEGLGAIVEVVIQQAKRVDVLVSSDLGDLFVQVEARGLDDDLRVNPAAVLEMDTLAVIGEAVDLADAEVHHSVVSADERQVRNRDGVVMRLQQALLPTLRRLQACVLVALPPGVEADDVAVFVGVEVRIKRPQEGDHVDPLGASGSCTSPEDSAMLRTMFQCCPQVFKCKGTSTHDNDTLAPEVEASDLVGVPIDLLAPEGLGVRPSQVTASSNAAVHVEADNLGMRARDLARLGICHGDIPSTIGPLLDLGDVLVATDFPPQELVRDGEYVSEDVMPW